jgi:hypothetical protein
VRCVPYRPRAALGALLVCAVMLPLLSGCTLWQRVFHRGGNKNFVGCTQHPFAGNADSRAKLKVPEGMSAPDTRNAVNIPALNSADPHTGKTEPCLAQPPNFFAQPLPLEQSSKEKKKARKQASPAPPAPAPAPAPATAPEPPTTPAPTPTPAPQSPATPDASGAPTTPPVPAPVTPSPSVPPGVTVPPDGGPG